MLQKGKQVVSFAALRDDGTTACGCWIYSGCYNEAGNNMARRDTTDPDDTGAYPKWAFSWPVNRRILYNRASADLEGKPWDPTPQAARVGRREMDRLRRARHRADREAGRGRPLHHEPGRHGAAVRPAGLMRTGRSRRTTSRSKSPIANLIAPKIRGNPVARVFKGDLEQFGDAKEFPYAATSYRLTEHFHFWTKHVEDQCGAAAGVLRRDLAKQLAKEKGIKKGGWVRVWSKRGSVKAKAVVTKRIKPLHVRRQDGAHRRHPPALGLHGRGEEGLRPELADALCRRRQYRDAGIQGVSGQHRADRRAGGVREADYDTISASRCHPRFSHVACSRGCRPNRDVEVAKLIDVSKCIGCKACQSACLEWNDKRAAGRRTIPGIYDNPADLTPDMFTVMRFTEWVNPETSNLEWLIRKDGCMHCEDPGCLKACPAPGAIVQYCERHRRLRARERCIGCGYCVKGCPFNIPRISQVDHKAYKCTLCSDRIAVGQGPACAKACPTHAIVFGTKEEMIAHADARIDDLKSRGFDKAGLYDPPGVGGTHVMYVLHHADQPEIYAGLPANPVTSTREEARKRAGEYIANAAMGLAVVAGAAGILRRLFSRKSSE